jgi:hypothetical protein
MNRSWYPGRVCTRERSRAGLCGWGLALAVGCSFDSSGGGKSGETLGHGETTVGSGSDPRASSSTGTIAEATEGTGEGQTTESSGDPVWTGTTADDAASEDTGSPPVLDDDDLLVRYYLDEPGAMPTAAHDAEPLEPFDLVHGWVPELSYVTIDGNRGLQWSEVRADGGPSAPVDGLKVRTRLEGRTAATIEVVADIQAVGDRSRVVTIGRGNDDVYLGLLASDDLLYFRWRKNVNAASWDVDFSGLGRRVFHLVLDATADDDDRVRLYIDGALQPPAQDVEMDDDAVITFEDGADLILGNRPPGSRSFEGVLYYAAIYHAAFDDVRVDLHAAVLENDDDTP